MTEIQQGANKAIAPAMTAASTEPPKKILLFITYHNFHEAGVSLSARQMCPDGEVAVLALWSASRPISLIGYMGYCLVLGRGGFPCGLQLSDLASDGFLLGLETRQ